MSPPHLDEELHDLLSGALSVEGRAAAFAHLAACEVCRALRDRTASLYGTLALAARPIAPRSALRARLDAATGSRLARFGEALARFFAVSPPRALQLLERVDDPSRWSENPLPGLWLQHLRGGPALGEGDAGFVKFSPEMVFPRHRHVGEERVLILQGGLVYPDGRRLAPGDIGIAPEDSQHEHVSVPGEETLLALVLYQTIEFT